MRRMRVGLRDRFFRPRKHVEHAKAEEVDDHRGERQRGDDPGILYRISEIRYPYENSVSGAPALCGATTSSG